MMSSSTPGTAGENVARRHLNSIVKLVIYIIAYVAVAALVQFLVTSVLPMFHVSLSGYTMYVNVLLALAFGYLIVSAFAEVIYWSMRFKYDHSTARAFRNVFLLIGIGVLVAAIAGAIGGGAAGVAPRRLFRIRRRVAGPHGPRPAGARPLLPPAQTLPTHDRAPTHPQPRARSDLA